MSWVDPVGLYRPGDTVIHRASVRVTFGALVALGLFLLLVRGPWPAVAALLVAVLAAAAARLPLRSTVRGLLPITVTAVVLAAYQTWQRGWEVGVEVSAGLLAVVVAATVVTATTPTDVLLDLVTRLSAPVARRLGIAPESVALAVALMLRSIPALGSLFIEVRDAARARGLERSPRALLVPFAVRTVARARTTGDALAARGLGD